MTPYRSHRAVTSYLRTQSRGRTDSRDERRNRAVGGPFITISRQTGAGAYTVAERIATILNGGDDDGGAPWTVFDRNLIGVVAEANRLPRAIVDFLEEEDRLLEHAGIVEEMFAFHPSVQSLIRKTSKTIYKLASMGRAILVGRAANLVTRDLPDGFHVRLVASLPARIDWMVRTFGLDPDRALERIEKEDRARRRYVKRYFRQDVEDSLLYHLVIDTERVGHRKAAEIVAASLSGERIPSGGGKSVAVRS